jgi:FixJ family two-component response regulator
MHKGSAATVFVVEDDTSLREGIASLLRSIGQKVETFESAEEFLARRSAQGPGCLILDVRLKDISGLELQRRLSATNDHIPIIFITGHGDVPMSVQTMKAGAADFLLKPFRDQDLIESVQAALRRDRAVCEKESEDAVTRANYRSLSERESEIMKLVVSGQRNKQIATAVGLSEVTVKIHRSQVMRKMGASSLPELVRIAMKIEHDPDYAVATSAAPAGGRSEKG